MKISRLNLAAAAALLLALAGASAQAQGTAPGVETGRELYMKNGCYSCHGTVGQGGLASVGPRLAPEPFPLEVFKVIVRNGKQSMPRFDARFVSDDQLQSIHQYLASIPKGRGAKDIPLLQPQP